jgi:hypothetical protein
MPMTSHMPFETGSVSSFRKRLYDTGRKADHVLKANGIDATRGGELKAAALYLTKSGLYRKASGQSILEKATNGNSRALIEWFAGKDPARERRNETNRIALVGLFAQTPHFDAEAMMAGRPQGDEFLREAAAELEAIDQMVMAIDPIWEELSYTEDSFLHKTEIFREFENEEMGHFYAWQVDDPFVEVEPSAEQQHEELLRI